MNRKRLFLVGGMVTIAIVVAAGAVAWSEISTGHKGAMAATGPTGTPVVAAAPGEVGVAGPFGPLGLTAFPSYFKRVTFANDQLGQSHEIAAHLPAGKYLVEVLTPNSPSGSSSDCMGVSFPLVPPVDSGMGFTGYVSVANDGDAATVSCYEQATDRNSTATCELLYIPVTPAR